MADPATFLASNSVLGALFSSENSLLIHLWDQSIFLSLHYYLIQIVNIKILSLDLSSKTTQSPFNWETLKALWWNTMNLIN